MADETGQIHGEAIRVTRLAASGTPLAGVENMIVSRALTNLTVTPVYSDGDEIDEKNASGEQCLYFKSPDNLQRADVSLEICTFDPFLSEMLSGGVLLEDAGLTGFGYPELGTIDATRQLSIEVWAKRIIDGSLDPDAPYAWWVVPAVRNLRVGEKQFANAASRPVFTGQAYENANWSDGPLNDWPVESDRVAQWFPTDSVPAATNGYAEVVAS